MYPSTGRSFVSKKNHAKPLLSPKTSMATHLGPFVKDSSRYLAPLGHFCLVPFYSTEVELQAEFFTLLDFLDLGLGAHIGLEVLS